jgi:hypothetical protein
MGKTTSRPFKAALTPAIAAAIVLALAPPTSARAPVLDPGEVLIRLVEAATQRVIQDSKWGFIGSLQRAINDNADACGVPKVPLDGVFGASTAAGARAVAECKGVSVPPEGADLTKAQFEAITGQDAPDALARARTLARTMEATDYDRLEWNICIAHTGDAGSVLTWGPYGATLGWGGELLSILRAVDRPVLERAFRAEGARGLDQLLALRSARQMKISSRHAYPGAAALMQSICAQKGQKAAWTRAFARLGAEPAVRAAYDARVWGDEAWFRTVVVRLSTSWREAGLEPTEVDFAFFLDRAIHMGWGRARFEAVDAALAAARAKTPDGEWTSARARFAVADAVRARAHPSDRLARDVMFLADAEAELAAAMAASPTWPKTWKAGWTRRANITAADVGLSDLRPAPDWRYEDIPGAEGVPPTSALSAP